MDNGQQIVSSQDSLMGRMTVGEGLVSEPTGIPNGDNNMGNFDAQHDYSGIGNTAMNNQVELPMPSETNMPSGTNGPVDLIMPPGEGGQTLGEIVDVPGAPVSSGGDMKEVEKSSKSQVNQKEDEIDPAIVKHFADGKVDRDDMGYITAEVNEKSNNPAEMVKFIMKARKTILEGSKGEQK